VIHDVYELLARAIEEAFTNVDLRLVTSPRQVSSQCPERILHPQSAFVRRLREP
jgi:hypothetical protein